MEVLRYGNFKEDCFVLDLTNESEFRINHVNNVESIKNIFIFGITPKDIGLHINLVPYLFTEHNKKHYLLSNKLSEINKQKNLKMQLWMTLKNKFEI